jgi:hypothetical protein
MRITQERLNANVRVSKVEVLLGIAIGEAIETVHDLSEAEVMEALANQLNSRVRRLRQAETKPYEGYGDEQEE